MQVASTVHLHSADTLGQRVGVPSSISSSAPPTFSTPSAPTSTTLPLPTHTSRRRDLIPQADLLPLLKWGILAEYLLPWSTIVFGVKQKGPPRWTTWLESYYIAIDPHLWVCLAKDDRVDERIKSLWRSEGIRLLAEGAPEDAVRRVEEQHQKVLWRRLRRRQCIYRAFCFFSPFLPLADRILHPVMHLGRQNFIDYHRRNSALSTLDIMKRAEVDERQPLSPHPPGSSSSLSFPAEETIYLPLLCTVWPVFTPHPQGSTTYSQYHFRHGNWRAEAQFALPDVPTPDASYLRTLYCLNGMQIAYGEPLALFPNEEAAEFPSPPPPYSTRGHGAPPIRARIAAMWRGAKMATVDAKGVTGKGLDRKEVVSRQSMMAEERFPVGV